MLDCKPSSRRRPLWDWVWIYLLTGCSWRSLQAMWPFLSPLQCFCNNSRKFLLTKRTLKFRLKMRAPIGPMLSKTSWVRKTFVAMLTLVWTVCCSPCVCSHVSISITFLGKHLWTVIAFKSGWKMCFAMQTKNWRFSKSLGTVLTFKGSVTGVQVHVIGQIMFLSIAISTNIAFKLFNFPTGWCCLLAVNRTGTLFIIRRA